ncbi:MAG: hypothetical protein HKN42_05975 [Granulosicoccus sp.]|nr:hypothetical protein [Granulosicoccus sp.]
MSQAARAFIDLHAQKWLSDAVVIDSIKAQNITSSGLSQTDIDTLDMAWRTQSRSGSGPMIADVLGNDLSAYLKQVQKESNGLITEIFAMDNRGLNVGQSNVTSDYWQGDESKWQKSYSVGPDAVFVDEVELDESSQRYQTQVSVTVVDPDTGEAIGAITIGIDAEGLMML